MRLRKPRKRPLVDHKFLGRALLPRLPSPSRNQQRNLQVMCHRPNEVKRRLVVGLKRSHRRYHEMRALAGMSLQNGGLANHLAAMGPQPISQRPDSPIQSAADPSRALGTSLLRTVLDFQGWVPAPHSREIHRFPRGRTAPLPINQPQTRENMCRCI